MEYVGQEKARSEIKQILDLGLSFPDRKSLARTILLYRCFNREGFNNFVKSYLILQNKSGRIW